MSSSILVLMKKILKKWKLHCKKYNKIIVDSKRRLDASSKNMFTLSSKLVQMYFL